MNLEIVLTPRARDTLFSVVTFIKSKWGQKSAEKFVDNVYKTLDTISKQPYMFKAYQEAEVRIGVITRQTSVVYRINENYIEVLFFWDNRQEPALEY